MAKNVQQMPTAKRKTKAQSPTKWNVN